MKWIRESKECQMKRMRVRVLAVEGRALREVR